MSGPEMLSNSMWDDEHSRSVACLRLLMVLTNDRRLVVNGVVVPY